MVNAAYNGYQNSITIAAAIIDTPFFKADRPAMMNYGAMGMVIGHEFTHGFDDAGRHYDAKGQLENWWSNTTEARFRERAQCIIKQYSDIFDVEAGKYLNGANSVGENVADNGGVREAILAYRNYVARLPGGDEPAVPHLTNFTSEQIFHLANANVSVAHNLVPSCCCKTFCSFRYGAARSGQSIFAWRSTTTTTVRVASVSTNHSRI